MDYLTSLKVFRAVVEAKSFTRAADLLGVSPPVVSRAIATLEQRLGNRLFHRTTRHISLTETAEQFFAGCSRVLDELDALEAQASNRTSAPTGMLRLVAHTTATVNRLVPLIATFRRRYPLIGLDVTLTERPVDLVADGYDLGVVLPFMLTSDTTVTRLLERIPLVIVVTPGYLEGKERPVHPAALAGLEFVAMHASIRKPMLTFRLDGGWTTSRLSTARSRSGWLIAAARYCRRRCGRSSNTRRNSSKPERIAQAFNFISDLFPFDC